MTQCFSYTVESIVFGSQLASVIKHLYLALPVDAACACLAWQSDLEGSITTRVRLSCIHVRVRSNFARTQARHQ